MLRTAVATGASFPDIRDIMFADRIDLSPEVLRDRAQEIHAAWSTSEDLALLQAVELPLRIDDDEYLVGLRAKISGQTPIPGREIADIRARITHLMNIGEDYNLRNPPVETFSQAQQRAVSTTQSYLPVYPTAAPNDRTRAPYSSQTETVSQTLTGSSSLSAKGHDAPPPWSQTFAGHRRCINTRGGPMNYYGNEEFKEIKGKLAEGMNFADIAKEWNYRRSAGALRLFTQRKGYQAWTGQQDDHLRELLKEHGNDLGEIERRLCGQHREDYEIEKRRTFLAQPQKKRLILSYRYTDEDDEYIRHQLAVNTEMLQIVRARFPHVESGNLRHHAKLIGALWGEEDNHCLWKTK